MGGHTMRISALILLAATGFGSGTAAAADLIVYDPEAIAAAADYDWSGAYAGLFGGAGGGDVTLTEPSGLADPLDLAAGSCAGWCREELRLIAARRARCVIARQADRQPVVRAQALRARIGAFHNLGHYSVAGAGLNLNRLWSLRLTT